MTNIFILAAQRSAIGSYGGSLKDTPPIDLAIPVAKDAIAKSGVPADAIQHAIYGHVIHTEPRDMYSPRCISIGAGLAETGPCLSGQSLMRKWPSGNCERNPAYPAWRLRYRACWRC